MRRYETTFIVNPQADDAAIDRQVSAVVDLIKSNGGHILDENRIGTRRLAYPIAGLAQGFYASLIFDAETSVLPRLDRHYKLEESYLRYLTIRYEGADPTEEEQAPGEPSRETEVKSPKSEQPEKAAPAPSTETAESADIGPAEPSAATPADQPVGEEPAAEKSEPAPDQPDPADEEL